MVDYPVSRTAAGDAYRTSVTPAEDVRTVLINRISWGAVIAGVVVALVTQILLTTLGFGIGIASLPPMTGEQPSAEAVSLAAGIWYVVTGILSSFAGGFVAARASGRPLGSTGGFHGLTSWAVTTLLMFYLLGSAVGGLVGGAFQGLASTVGGATQTAAAAGAQVSDPLGAIDDQIRQQTGGQDPAKLRDTAIAAVRAAVTGDPAQQQDARDRAAQAIAQAQNISVDEARGKVDGYIQQYRQALDKARQSAEAAAKVVSTGALIGFAALVLGAVAAWFGGRTGTVRPQITETVLAEPVVDPRV